MASRYFLEGDLLGGMAQFDGGEITQMGLRPIALARVTMALTEQEPFETLAGPALIDHGPVAGAHQIADGFILFVGHVDGGQLAGAG